MLKKFPVGQKEKKRGLLLFKLGSLLAESGLDDTHIFVILRHVDSQEAWRKYADRPGSERCYINIISRIREKTPYRSASEQSGFRLVRFLDHFKEQEGVPWLIENFLAEESISTFLGRSGVGKTMLVQDLCAKLIVGEDFLNFKNVAGRPLTVMYFSFEMSESENLDRFVEHRKRYNEEQVLLINQHLLPIYTDDVVRWCNPQDEVRINKIIDEHRPDVVFIDSASMSFADSMNEEKDVKRSMENLIAMRKRFKFAAIIIHHPRKSQQGVRKDSDTDGSHGAQVIANQSTGVFQMDRKETENGSETTLTNLKLRRAKEWGTIRIEVDESLSFYRPTTAALPAAKPKELPVGRPTGTLAKLGEDIRANAKQRGGRATRSKRDELGF